MPGPQEWKLFPLNLALFLANIIIDFYLKEIRQIRNKFSKFIYYLDVQVVVKTKPAEMHAKYWDYSDKSAIVAKNYKLWPDWCKKS